MEDTDADYAIIISLYYIVTFQLLYSVQSDTLFTIACRMKNI